MEKNCKTSRRHTTPLCHGGICSAARSDKHTTPNAPIDTASTQQSTDTRPFDEKKFVRATEDRAASHRQLEDEVQQTNPSPESMDSRG